MAGSPTCGKISTGMRRTARMAHRAMAINATTTVSGLRSAARTRRMLLPQVCQDALWGRESSVQLINSLGEDKTIVVVAQREARVDSPQPTDLYAVGSLAVV